MLAATGLLLVALAVAPLGGVLRRRETAWIAGGLAALIVCALVPPLPGALGKLVSVNQIRRLPFLEMPWLLVALGAAGLVVLLRRQALVAAAVAGIVLGVAIPRHTTYETVAAVLACTGSVAGLGWLLRRGVSLPVPATAWLAAAVLAAPWALAAAPDLARAVADPPPAPSCAHARRDPGGAGAAEVHRDRVRPAAVAAADVAHRCARLCRPARQHGGHAGEPPDRPRARQPADPRHRHAAGGAPRADARPAYPVPAGRSQRARAARARDSRRRASCSDTQIPASRSSAPVRLAPRCRTPSSSRSLTRSSATR